MKSSVKIGRDPANDIVINEPRVSRHHAIITVSDSGEYEVKDLNSSNGTYVNGQRIGTTILRPGDQLQVAASMVDWEADLKDAAGSRTNRIIEEEPVSVIRKTVTVGSDPDNDIVIDDKYVSARHAAISVLKNRDYYLQDLGSSNGCFVNGAKIIAKNFSLTDVVRLAGMELPGNWFRHPGLRRHFYRDHRKAIWITVSLLLVVTASVVAYMNRCSWFGRDCNLAAGEIYDLNKNSLVHIDHSYYYTIGFAGRKYYVGKNKIFTEQTEANTEAANILPYGTVSGSGCFVSQDGSVLTAASVTNPWLDQAGQAKMLREVMASRTLPGLRYMDQGASICGETASLKWIHNGAINNHQNYTEAVAGRICPPGDSLIAIIRSVKNQLPVNASVANYSYDERAPRLLHTTPEKYYGAITLPAGGKTITDTFYLSIDTFAIDHHTVIPLAEELPVLADGSPVFNARGELAGIVRQQRVVLLHRFVNQLNHP